MSKPGQVKQWVLVAPTKRGIGRPEIVMGHLVTEAEALRMAPDYQHFGAVHRAEPAHDTEVIA